MKTKQKKIAIVLFILFAIIAIIVYCKETNLFNIHKNAFLEDTSIHTCTVGDNELELQIRYFTNYELNLKDEHDFAALTANSTGVDLSEQEIVLTEQKDGLYAYLISLTMQPLLDKAEYGTILNLDKEYTFNDLKNISYQQDPNDLFSGMDYINIFRQNSHTAVFFDKNYDLTNISVNNTLHEITSNEIEKNDDGTQCIMAKGEAKEPQIIGFTYTYDNLTYCAGNQVQYRDYTTSDIKERLE